MFSKHALVYLVHIIAANLSLVKKLSCFLNLSSQELNKSLTISGTFFSLEADRKMLQLNLATEQFKISDQ